MDYGKMLAGQLIKTSYYTHVSMQTGTLLQKNNKSFETFDVSFICPRKLACYHSDNLRSF
jgi:hypothetical protein